MQIKIKRNTKKHNEFDVNMKLTEGAILAINNALQAHAAQGSAVASDLHTFMEQAMQSIHYDVHCRRSGCCHH
jgi:ATP-dependent protease HslVU (ClpYQ) ATPase subunit